MATEMQLKVLFGKKSHGPVRLDFRKKKQRKVVSFSMLFFNVYTHVDNKERARASD